MKTFTTTLLRFLRSLPLLIVSPFLVAIPMIGLALADLLWFVTGKRKTPPRDTRPSTEAASVVIPNWNGADLLQKYLPHVIAAMDGNPDNEVIVVENGSTDDSAQVLREQFPTVRVVQLETNLGFGGGSNAGFRAAKNDIVILLNSDMRPEPGFLAPLLGRLLGRNSLRRLLPDLLQRSEHASAKKLDSRKPGGKTDPPRPPPRRSCNHRSLSLFLRRRWLLRLRSPQVPRARRI